MTTKTSKGPVTVANTAELRVALTAGYSADEIVLPDNEQAVAAARTEGLADGERKGKADAANQVAAARVEGATTERDRIKAVEGTVLPGHEALIATLKFDGKTTGPEAAAQVITAERAKLGKRADDLNADAAAATTTVTPPPAAAAKPKVDQNLPVDDRCKAEWQHDPQLRADFGSVEEYISYSKATESGHVRVLRDRTSQK
jgi:hypothetical protein